MSLAPMANAAPAKRVSSTAEDHPIFVFEAGQIQARKRRGAELAGGGGARGDGRGESSAWIFSHSTARRVPSICPAKTRPRRARRVAIAAGRV